MNCRWCNGKTRVSRVTHKIDKKHRWLCCNECDRITRTTETYDNTKPGPPSGSKKSGPAAYGSRNGASVLLESDVIKLREMAASGTMHKDLAKIFGVGITHVSRIVARKLWKHI